MTITRGQRFIGFLINLITFNGLGIGNLILLLTSGRTIGGIVAGYKYEHGGIEIVLTWLVRILISFLILFTLGIFWIVDIATMEKRDGRFYEAWSNNRKIAL
ncbi:hypothetical protein [Candidatus Mycoplasma mahonii]|uniref:hypothetical protein n=1 Tax=Candidatus Mycoplasma mahonii TaxID=3004105 RepID=UPI0026EC7464|nr:hypothetical protein [Candidatus Mycoplasma mahonii]WKX02436.1 hypothetical protein O3I44_03530 [Candidatus Mycoplasma mahonii]